MLAEKAPLDREPMTILKKKTNTRAITVQLLNSMFTALIQQKISAKLSKTCRCAQRSTIRPN